MNLFEEDNRKVLSLSQLNGLVREVVELSLNGTFWVTAELANVHESRGHCYMELVEKEDGKHTPTAQSRACCWANTWMRIAPRFVRTTGQELHAGMKVLLNVKASFHEAYGFSWIVNDIDASYTMGDMARRRQEILRTLRAAGVLDLNKSLGIPMFARRIAVISSATAAGYGDFCNQLNDNEFGFAFTTQLFPAVMQGEQVEQSVISALDSINERVEDFDVVVIIRGGGSTADLSGFDTLALAENVANFPLPIITGIGHDRDQSVLDIIACVSVKTPTAAAAYLIDNLANTLDQIEDAALRISRAVQGRMEVERMRIQRLEQGCANVVNRRVLVESNRIKELEQHCANAVNRRVLVENSRIDSITQHIPLLLATKIEREGHRLQMLEQRTKAVDPINILRRGYSITLHNGVAMTDAASLTRGDELTIFMAKGVVRAKVDD